MKRQLSCAAGLLSAALLVAGCERDGLPPSGSARQVVVYTALDREFSEPILEAFTKRTGIEVLANYDTESTKTVGLANRIRSERTRPRCDVFWNNEILNTLQLKSEGLLAPCHPEEAQNYPEQWRDPEGYWHGFAARARIILVNTDLVKDQDYPKSIRDLADPRFKGRTGIAKPLFGTTASHIACLFAFMGPEAGTSFLNAVKHNETKVYSGNRGCAAAVADGTAAFALTDTDDAVAELVAGKPVRIVYPDAQNDGMGTLFLPNTLAIVKGGPNPKEAAELVGYLLSPQVEQRLSEGPSAQIPLNLRSKSNDRIQGPSHVKAMRVSFEKAAEQFVAARQVVEEQFLR